MDPKCPNCGAELDEEHAELGICSECAELFEDDHEEDRENRRAYGEDDQDDNRK